MPDFYCRNSFDNNQRIEGNAIEVEVVQRKERIVIRTIQSLRTIFIVDSVHNQAAEMHTSLLHLFKLQNSTELISDL